MAGGGRPGGDAAQAAQALARAAGAALALQGTGDPVALVEVMGEACRESADGFAWRFFRVEPQSGALREGAAADGPPRLPAAGGALEWLLHHEQPLWDAAACGVDPALDGDLWPRPPAGLVGLPLGAAGRLQALLLVALDAPAPPVPAMRTTLRLLADQFTLALERDLLARELARARARMRQIESRASTGEESFSELMGVVAHEIRTPLTSIKAYTETLLDADAEEFDRRRDFLGVINDECDRLARLVSDALDLSRLEAGHRALRVRALDPRDLLSDLAATLEPEAVRAGVVLEVEAAIDDGAVEGDPDLLKQLLLNLASNALKFSPAGSCVTIGAHADGREWLLSVRDHGGGIPEEQLERIFERFYRVELKGGRRVPGTGLGLAIARHIVELHGGSIRAANAPGGGSLFTVRLPLRQRAPLAVRQVVADLVGRPDVGPLLEAGVAMVAEVMDTEIVSLLLVDPDEGDLYVAAALGLDDSARDRRLHYHGGVAGAAVRAGQPLLVHNIETDRRFARRSHPQYFTKSLLCAPVFVGDAAVGVINVNNKSSHEELDEKDRLLLAELVARFSATLSRVHAYPDAPSAIEEALRGVRSLARLRHDLLLGRRERARHASWLAGRLGLDAATTALVARLAALAAPGPCAPAAGGDAAEEPPGLDDPALRRAARAILLARRSRFDGGDGAAGPAGGAIPAGARILAVLDEFEALVHSRPYRPARTADEALLEIERESGRRFDPAVVAALAALLAAEGWVDRREEAA